MISRSRRAFGVVLLAVVTALPVGALLGSIRTSGRIIVTGLETVDEDLYAIGNRVLIEGTIRGDLVVLTGELVVTGRVDGNVVGLVGGTARITGSVGGSVRLAALRLDTAGTIDADIASLAADATISSTVGRDVLLIAGDSSIGGTVGRDVRSQSWSLDVRAQVGRDVHARVDDLTVTPTAAIAGDLLYQASDRISVAEEVVVGQVARRTVLTPVWARALNTAIVWLSLAAFIVGGIVLTWLFRRTSARAVDIVGRSPGRAALAGIGVVVLPPVVALPLGLTLVGLPLALLLLVAWLAVLVLGPLPAVAWAGGRLLGGRGGAYGAVVAGALAWRGAMWALSLVAALLYLGALTVGSGAAIVAAWEQRREGDGSWRPLPPE
jgi:hypothetical protein